MERRPGRHGHDGWLAAPFRNHRAGDLTVNNVATAAALANRQRASGLRCSKGSQPTLQQSLWQCHVEERSCSSVFL